ncbi:MAG: hypothetical protein LBI74_05540 [Synergistaceae bacterium]|jgi:prolyl-tRNA synthetase|nr:hypothetical protein [Synergistaceae bacterium]
MSASKALVPKTASKPAKVKDPGVIGMVMAGEAAFNSKSGELLLLPEGESKMRELSSRIASRLFDDCGIQRVDCGNDAALFSLAERYVREWGDAATAFLETRGRSLRVIGWSRGLAESDAAADAIKSALATILGDVGLRSVREAIPDGRISSSLACLSEAGSIASRDAFACLDCGEFFLPDSPLDFAISQPGEGEADLAVTEIPTPGADTIQKLCSQLSVDVSRTIKAMLYVAFDASSKPCPTAAFLRGDLGVSMNKLTAWLDRERGLSEPRSARTSELAEMFGPVAGYCGPVGMPDHVITVGDRSITGSKNIVAGANRPGYHLTGCCHGRDFRPPEADIAMFSDGSPCRCGGRVKPVTLRECGAIMSGRAPKILSFRDRDGLNEFPARYEAYIHLDRLLLSRYR